MEDHAFFSKNFQRSLQDFTQTDVILDQNIFNVNDIVNTPFLNLCKD
jgi:hypothetical protein